MSKPRKQKRPADVNELAHILVKESTQEQLGFVAPPTAAQVSLLMSELGRKGGKIGGKKSLETMTEAARRKRARKAAKARWKKGTWLKD